MPSLTIARLFSHSLGHKESFTPPMASDMLPAGLIGGRLEDELGCDRQQCAESLICVTFASTKQFRMLSN
jgi:hypothetical protein